MLRKSLGAQATRTASLFGQSLASAALLVAWADSPAAAQDSPPPEVTSQTPPTPTLALGGNVDGEINAADPEVRGRHYDEYRIALHANDLVRIDMASRQTTPSRAEPFDPYLEIFREGDEVPLAANNDFGSRGFLTPSSDTGPDRLNARLVLVAPADGDYRIRAAGYRGRTGPYRLSLRSLPNVTRPPTPMSGETAAIHIDENSPIAAQRGRGYRYADFTFDGRGGNRALVRAATADSPVRFILFDAGGEVVGATSGLGAMGSQRILAVLPRTGRYTVRAQVSLDEMANDTVRVEQAARPAAGEPPLLTSAAALSGHLGIDSEIQMESDSAQIDFFYRVYRLPVTGGETITIDMSSTDFDGVLEAGINSVLGFAVAAQDDDGGGELNPRLVLHPEADGVVYIRARSLGPDFGDFQIRLTR